MSNRVITLKVNYPIDFVRETLGVMRDYMLFGGKANTIKLRVGELSSAMNYWYALIYSTEKGRENDFRICLHEEEKFTRIEVHPIQEILSPESVDNLDKLIDTIGIFLDGSVNEIDPDLFDLHI